jgi:FlaA1/EpsC-like NDP-sugar epimerase
MRLVVRHRLWHVLVDAAILVGAWYAAFVFRFDGMQHPYAVIRDQGLLRVVTLKLLAFLVLGVYARWWRYTSLRDVIAIVRAAVVGEVAAYLALVLFPIYRGWHVPRGVIALDFAFTLAGVIGVRALTRLIRERPPRRAAVARGREVLVVGAGECGDWIVSGMVKGRTTGYTPIGLLDDDPRKHGMRLHGVPVLGGRDTLRERLRSSPPDEVIIAMPSADGRVRQEVFDVCRAENVTVKTAPGLSELLQSDGDILAKLREVQVEDVLGRPPVKLDLVEIGRYLQGRVVLVTGAGGSIGSELCRQIARLGPARLVLVDHSEGNLFTIEAELLDRHVAGVVPAIGDVKDVERMRALLDAHRPAVVFHAAAYKHVPMMERHPAEAIRNNTLATRDFAELARAAGVERFVLVSTDKAVNARTVMGASKALCEWVVEAAAQGEGETRFIAVRFGNVLGSSGSVIPIFQRQIAAGGPVTVTDPRMTRFFMTIPEAAQLILEAGSVGESGDIFVLDMGDPVRIVDLAENMVRLSGKEPGRDIEVRIVGIRPGEKLHEELFEADESVERTQHVKLLVARRPAIDAGWLAGELDGLESLIGSGARDDVASAVVDLVQRPVRLGGEPAAAARPG